MINISLKKFQVDKNPIAESNEVDSMSYFQPFYWLASDNWNAINVVPTEFFFSMLKFISIHYTQVPMNHCSFNDDDTIC